MTDMTKVQPATKRPRKMARELQTQDSATTRGTAAIAAEPAPPSTDDKVSSKVSQVLNLLRRPAGASIEELIAATGWLPHTTRAALTGLRKKGHLVERSRIDGESRYAITAAPAQ